MVRKSLIQLPDQVGQEVDQYAERRGLAFATAVRCIVVEYMREIAPVTACKRETGTASTPNKEIPACQ